MIRKEGSKYVVRDSSGKKKLGSHNTKSEALSQLGAIEASKSNKFNRLRKSLKLGKNNGR